MQASTSATGSTPSSSSVSSSSTILADLHSLFTSQSSLTAALPYLHPYSPSPYKGKAKATVLGTQDQIDLLSRLKATTADARVTLGGGDAKEEGRVKLMRALKDVSTNQQALLPTSNAFATHTPTASVLPSKLITLSPVDLLRTLAESLGIQFYLEESQFGLLKTGLTLAGACFVVDLELEVDAVAGNEDDDEMEVDNKSETGQGTDRESRGRVRLSKITASHAKGDIQGKSDWIAKALKGRVEGYLDSWNAKARTWVGQVELTRRVMELGDELKDLKSLDEIADSATDSMDWFAEVETASSRISSLSSAVFLPETQPIFPSFHLLPVTSAPQPKIRLRPARPGETVAMPTGLTEDTEEEWLKGHWIVEYVGRTEQEDGMVVRRSWLSETSDGDQTNWDGLIRVEHLLFRQHGRPELMTGPAIAFPYTSDFVHSANVKGSLAQRWAISEPGPEGFVIGRIGLPRGLSGFIKLIELLHTQTILNELFISAFSPDKLDLSDDDCDGGLEDLLSETVATAVTARIKQRALEATIQLSASNHQDSVNSTTLLSITLTPCTTEPFVEVTCGADPPLEDDLHQKLERGIDRARRVGVDTVGIVRAILDSCME